MTKAAGADTLIPVWDYRRDYDRDRHEILAAVDRVFGSGRLILGDEVVAFEAAMAKFCGGAYGVGVGSGTDALFLALKALGVGPGDEVVTVANTAVPTVSAIVSAGAVPRFVDIDRGTGLMDVSQVGKALGEKTALILPVHLYGQCVAIEELARFGVPILEDCAQSAGALRHGRPAGSLGNIAAFSFYPTKVLGGFGDSGMVVTNDAALAEKVRNLRMYGMAGGYSAVEHGYNSRLDEVHAAILRIKLVRLNEDVNRRRALAAVYDRELQGLGLVLPAEAPGNRHAYCAYAVRHPERERVVEELRRRSIQTNICYSVPIHTMPAYRQFGGQDLHLPQSEQVVREIFSLPLFPSLTEAEQERICTALRQILGGGG